MTPREHGPENTGSNVDDPTVDPSLLSEVAAAVRDHVELRFDYDAPEGTGRLQLEPYRLVSWQRRWFVVARDGSGPAAGHRTGWTGCGCSSPGGQAVHAATVAGRGLHVVRAARGGLLRVTVHTRITVDAPAEQVLARINPTVGVVESVDADHCVLVTGGDSVELIAVYLGLLGLDFHVADPPELVDAVAALGERYGRALPAAGPSTSGAVMARSAK